jgi:cytochrome c-type biogenesis protein CcsB
VGVNESLAELSNNLVYSAMVVYTLAMVGFAAATAFGAGRARASAGAAAPGAPVREPVGVGATAVAPPPVSPTSNNLPPYAGTRAPSEPVGPPGRIERIALSLTLLAAVLHVGAVVARGLAAGRAPWANMYEFSVAASAAAAVAFLVLQRRFDLRALGVVVVPVILLTLGLSVAVLYQQAAEVIPVLDSYWLVIHVAAAIVCAGALTVGAGLLVLYLLRSRADRRGAAGPWMSRLPAAAAMEKVAYRIHAFVFPLWTFAVIAGAIWAENAWGRYWGWDPKETWAFITWVVYAAYLHARATAGWRGRSAAYIALLGYACLIFNLVGVNIWFVGLHSYAN